MVIFWFYSWWVASSLKVSTSSLTHLYHIEMNLSHVQFGIFPIKHYLSDDGPPCVVCANISNKHYILFTFQFVLFLHTQNVSWFFEVVQQTYTHPHTHTHTHARKHLWRVKIELEQNMCSELEHKLWFPLLLDKISKWYVKSCFCVPISFIILFEK